MKYLVSGASGFLGQKLVERLVKQDCDIVALARNEGQLVKLKETFNQIEIMVGDIADPYSCDKAMDGVDGVFHLAALKHVGLAEVNVREAIINNIPLPLLEAVTNHRPQFIVGISTDKAASRKGVYGTTKFLMERLFAEYERFNPDIKFRIVRYGNVIYSTGSVLVKWKEKMMRGEPVIVTDLNATRFFWTVDQAVDLIFDCLKNAVDSTPYVTQMKAMRIEDLLKAMLNKYGRYPEAAKMFKVIGLQPGENLHEIIVEGAETSEQVEKFTLEEISRMI